MDDAKQRLEVLISQLHAISQAGKRYGKDVFDQQRYAQLTTIAKQLTALLTTASPEDLQLYFDQDVGYVTPKVDVRAVTFIDDQILLVREKATQSWSIPGGFADIGYSAREIAIKETREEAGLLIEPTRLLAVLDMKKHPYTKQRLKYIYKMIFECTLTGQGVPDGIETDDVATFSLPAALQLKLSLGRNLPEDIKMAFSAHHTPDWQTIFD